jgi:phosphoribosylamine--glycine ligase
MSRTQIGWGEGNRAPAFKSETGSSDGREYMVSLPPEHLGVLEVGKDARTDALSAGCAESDSHPEAYGISEFSAPGMSDRCVTFLGGSGVSLTDANQIVEFAREVQPDLAVIGPEEPLMAGVVDRLEDDLEIPCFGPRQDLARIETSKTWARELIAKYEIGGNPDYKIISDHRTLDSYAKALGQFVIKPDGLTGGKGVRLFPEHFETLEASLDYGRSLIDHEGLVLIEQQLEGQEFSLQTITDGVSHVHCPVVQDYKRAYEFDEGPNTGGMGSYSCADFSLPFLTPEDVSAARAINEAVIRALHAETGRPYRGVLYGGFIATSDGVKVIEYNARFGDPEALNVLSLLESDLLEVCWNAANGTLSEVEVRFSPKATVCKYVVPKHYPKGKGAGDPINVPVSLDDPKNTRLFWAAVNKVGGQTVLTGSRAVAVVGIGETLDEAEARAEAEVRRVTGRVRHRSDIGTASSIAKRIDHMVAVRGATL